MITCFIRDEIDPFRVDALEPYPRAWRQAIPRRENFAFAKRESSIRREDRLFLRLASAPHAPVARP